MEIGSAACEKEFRGLALQQAVVYTASRASGTTPEEIVDAAQQFYAFLKDPHPQADPKALRAA